MKTAFVTGGSGGLGAAIVKELDDAKYKVYAGNRIKKTPLINAKSVSNLTADVTDPKQMQSAMENIIDDCGRIDAVICNAGINESAPAEELSLERASRIIDTNFWGVVHTIRAALPQMRKQRHGTIVVIGSLAGIVSPPGESYYAASKHAIRGFLESLQYEVAAFGVRIHLAEPGFIQTNLAKGYKPPDNPIDCYQKLRQALKEHWQGAISNGMPSQQVANEIVEMIENTHTPFRKRIGTDASWVPRFKRWLPAKLFFAITKRKFGISRLEL